MTWEATNEHYSAAQWEALAGEMGLQTVVRMTDDPGGLRIIISGESKGDEINLAVAITNFLNGADVDATLTDLREQIERWRERYAEVRAKATELMRAFG